MKFSNASIDITLLPTIQPDEFIALEKGYKKVILIENIIVALLFLAGFMVLYFTDSLSEITKYQWLPLIGLCLILVFLFWFRPKAFSRKGYQLRTRDIVFRKGLWWQQETIIPFVRIQHSEVTQGPLGRLLGFSTLKLFTAGGSKSDLSIPALSTETAQKLENFVSQKAGIDENV